MNHSNSKFSKFGARRSKKVGVFSRFDPYGNKKDNPFWPWHYVSGSMNVEFDFSGGENEITKEIGWSLVYTYPYLYFFTSVSEKDGSQENWNFNDYADNNFEAGEDCISWDVKKDKDSEKVYYRMKLYPIDEDGNVVFRKGKTVALRIVVTNLSGTKSVFKFIKTYGSELN